MIQRANREPVEKDNDGEHQQDFGDHAGNQVEVLAAEVKVLEQAFQHHQMKTNNHNG